MDILTVHRQYMCSVIKYKIYVYEAYNLAKSEVYPALPQFSTDCTSTLYFKTLHYYCIYPSEKSH